MSSMRSVKSTSTLNTKIENRRSKLNYNSNQSNYETINKSSSKKDLTEMSINRDKGYEDIKFKKEKTSSVKKRDSDEFFNKLSLRGMPGINTSALNQQAIEKLQRDREEKKLNSQRKLKKLTNTTSTQDLYLKNIGINFKNFNIRPLKEVSKTNIKDNDAFINSMENRGVYETANYNDKENIDK